MRTKALALTALTLLVASGILSGVPAASGANVLNYVARDINTSWGTPGSPTGASPGDTNVPLTITFQYVYPVGASSIQGLLTLPNGFTLYDGSNETFATTSGSVATDSVFQIDLRWHLPFTGRLAGPPQLHARTLDVPWGGACPQ